MVRAQPGTPEMKFQNSPHFFGRKYSETMPLANMPSDPLPGDIRATADLKLGDLIWRNDRHAIYNVEVTRLDPPVFYVPPLVVKPGITPSEEPSQLTTEEPGQLATEEPNQLATEAGMYGHIEQLQGVVAPRCYGYFSTADDSSGAVWFYDPPPVDLSFQYWGMYAERTECKRMEILLLEKVGDHLPHKQAITDQVVCVFVTFTPLLNLC